MGCGASTAAAAPAAGPAPLASNKRVLAWDSAPATPALAPVACRPPGASKLPRAGAGAAGHRRAASGAPAALAGRPTSYVHARRSSAPAVTPHAHAAGASVTGGVCARARARGTAASAGAAAGDGRGSPRGQWQRAAVMASPRARDGRRRRRRHSLPLPMGADVARNARSPRCSRGASHTSSPRRTSRSPFRAERGARSHTAARATSREARQSSCTTLPLAVEDGAEGGVSTTHTPRSASRRSSIVSILSTESDAMVRHMAAAARHRGGRRPRESIRGDEACERAHAREE